MDIRKNDINNLDAKKRLEISVFHENEALSFIHRKCEKITCAIYLVTNHLPESEPLKKGIREEGVGLVKDTISSANNFSDNLAFSEKFKKRLITITSFLDLLSEVGFISKMNHEILKTEIVGLASFIDKKTGNIDYADSPFDGGFFDIPEPAQKDLPETTVAERGFGSEERGAPDFIKDIYKGQASKGQMSFKADKDTSSNPKKVSETGSGRKQKIINYIKVKKEVGVKDIASVIKDVSEKTLQRDLVALVKAGVLKKKGERRWSTYFLS